MKTLIYEYRKIFTAKHVLFILAALILQVWLGFLPNTKQHSYLVEVYKEYMTFIGGKYTSEKREMLTQCYDEITQIIGERESILEAYTKDEISLEELMEHNLAYHKADSEKNTVEYLLQKCDYFDIAGSDCTFFRYGVGGFSYKIRI